MIISSIVRGMIDHDQVAENTFVWEREPMHINAWRNIDNNVPRNANRTEEIFGIYKILSDAILDYLHIEVKNTILLEVLSWDGDCQTRREI